MSGEVNGGVIQSRLCRVGSSDGTSLRSTQAVHAAKPPSCQGAVGGLHSALLNAFPFKRLAIRLSIHGQDDKCGGKQQAHMREQAVCDRIVKRQAAMTIAHLYVVQTVLADPIGVDECLCVRHQMLALLLEL